MFYQLSIVTLKTSLYMFRTELYQKASRRLRSQWLSFLYFKWYPLFLNQSQKSTKFHDVRKSGDVQQTKWYMQKLLVLLWGFCIPSFRVIAYVIDKQSGTCRRYPLLQWLYVPSVKTTTCVCNSFNNFCNTDHTTHLVTSCYTLLHQAAKGEEKNSLRKRREF